MLFIHTEDYQNDDNDNDGDDDDDGVDNDDDDNDDDDDDDVNALISYLVLVLWLSCALCTSIYCLGVVLFVRYVELCGSIRTVRDHGSRLAS